MLELTRAEFALVKKRDPAVWERIFPDLWSLGVTVARVYQRQLGSGLLEDFVSDAIGKAISRLPQLADYLHLRRTVAKATENLIRDELKRLKRTKHGSGRVDSYDELVWNDENPHLERPGLRLDSTANESDFGGLKRIRPDEAAALNEIAIKLDHALRRIDRRHSAVVADLYFEDLKYRRVAKKRQLSINSVGVYSKRGLQAMLKHLPKRDPALFGRWGGRGRKRIRRRDQRHEPAEQK